MSKKPYINRLFDKELEFYLKSVGAIQIVGPKWCGKSRTAERYAKSIIDLLDDSKKDQYISLAMNAPEVLLNSGKKPILIDEWQVISFIWNSIKREVDKTGEFGQYILTGSVTDNTINDGLSGDIHEKHTGTGRIIKKKMRTLSLFESGDSIGSVSLNDLKNNIFYPSICNNSISDYSYFICRGGWPLAINDDKDIALQQAKSFYDGLVNEDIFSLRDLPLRKDPSRSKKLLRAYARSISTQESNESIKEDLIELGDDFSKEVFAKYMLALQRLYVIEELEAWNPNLRSKTAIRAKNTRHFVDPSIATAALNITPSSMFADMRTFGLLFESLAIRDLRIYCDSINANVYHYRDKADREADAVIEFEDGSWALVEVKLSNQEEISKASEKLLKLSNDIDIKEHPKPAFLMVITAQNVAMQDENGVYIVPLGCLKP